MESDPFGFSFKSPADATKNGEDFAEVLPECKQSVQCLKDLKMDIIIHTQMFHSPTYEEFLHAMKHPEDPP